MWKDILYLTIQNLIINNIPKKEEYFCIELPKLENNKECSFYQLSINSDETHACIPDEINEKCKEEYKWNKVPKILEVRLELNSCSYYSVLNNSLFVCINDTSIDSNYWWNAHPIPITPNETPRTEKYFCINPLSSPYRAHIPDTILYYLGVWTMPVEFKVNIIKNDIKDYETIINDDLIISNGSTRAWINEINSESENLCKEIKYCFEVIIE